MRKILKWQDGASTSKSNTQLKPIKYKPSPYVSSSQNSGLNSMKLNLNRSSNMGPNRSLDMGPKRSSNMGINGVGMSGFGNFMGGAEGVLNGAFSLINSENAAKNADVMTVGNALLKSGNPYAMLAGLAVNTMAVTDGFTNKINVNDAEKLGISKSTAIFNNIGRWLVPGSGYFTNNINTPKEFEKGLYSENVLGSYGGHTSDRELATKYGGTGTFFNNKINKFITKAQQNEDTLDAIGRINTLAKSSNDSNTNDITSQNINKFYGSNYNKTQVGKSGLKLLSKEELFNIYSKKQKFQEISKFQNGGSILIPNGSLHARRHHMEDSKPEIAKDLTNKGIPVVITDDNGKIEQVAEIEKDELIFELELTKKIEKLWKDGSEKAMIEAGKLISETLFTNCDDNTGLLKEIK